MDIPGLNLHRTHSGLYDDKEETCFVSEPSCIEDTLSKIVIPRLQIVAGRGDTLESQTHHIRPILLLLHCHWHKLYNTARRMLPCSLTNFHYCQTDPTNSLTADSILHEETNNHINTNCHSHHCNKQSITDDLHSVTLFQPCGHLTVCEICANEALLCPICDEIVYGSVKMSCRIIIV